MKKLFLLCAVFLVGTHAGEITIAVAANVSYAMAPLKKAFEEAHDTKINVILGSSGKLTAQITHGAPYDIFMSANMQYPNRLYVNGIAVTKPIIYARGALALFCVKKCNLAEGIDVLKQKNIKRIAIGNPKTAPYGEAGKEVLVRAKLYDVLKDKLVYGESIAQTLIYATRATDAGLVAKSSLFSPKMSQYKKGINWIEVPSALYSPISQGIVILKHGENNKQVKAFYDFMLSSKAQNILKDYGYK